ncbi:hypothetical protein [Streptomyces sp. JJ36]|uniref:hypothetical protein n=1 Tax=Streptomyces sp. JJ36 TaxID=2736645 RepID=UPI001F371405|nr:hypothetical protein [Streptomyces sp. JJ36]MCF6525621.1 hypothetical protein [Streptomyces sp. JJ36]
MAPRTLPQRARRRSRTACAPLVLAAAAAAVSEPAAAPALAAPPAVSAPAAAAEPVADGLEMAPRKVPQGGRAELRVRFCGTDTSALATSVAFERDVRLRPEPGGAASVLTGTATVAPEAETGTYAVDVECDGATGLAEGSFRVVPGTTRPASRQAQQEPPPEPSPEQEPQSQQGRQNGQLPEHERPAHERQAEPPRPARHQEPHAREEPRPSRDLHASPVAPVRAGGGATAGDRDGAGTGPSAATALTLTGGALVLGLVWAGRRRAAAGAGGGGGAVR